MQQLTHAQALAAVAAHANNNTITVQQLQQLLANVSVTFAQVTYVTQVTLAIAHKAQNIQKVTTANVMLCSNIKAHTDVYTRKVQRSAAKYAQNSAAAVKNFKAAKASYVHTNVHSIVQNINNANKFYLYVFYNNASSSLYVHNNAVVTKQHVAAYCTTNASNNLLQQNDNTVYNVTHNIVHNVKVHTIALHNVVSIRARKQLLFV